MPLVPWRPTFSKMYSLLSLFCLLSVVGAASEPVYGDSKCRGPMCITAFVNSTSTTTYKISLKKPKESIGWMAMGFGESMLSSPMVIMWRDEQGGVKLSQRKAVAYREPEVDRNPERVATVYEPLTLMTSTEMDLAFTIPSSGADQEPIIFAFSETPPSADGHISQHHGYGKLQLNLQRELISGEVAPPKLVKPPSVAIAPELKETSQGDSKCWGGMCVTAFVNSTTTTTYQLSLKKDKESFGWMAMGFGRKMQSSPMIIMWHDGQGNITLSQRKATDYIEPEVDPNPERVATVYMPLTSTTESLINLAFTIASNPVEKEPIIMAYSRKPPSANGRIQEHDVFSNQYLSLQRELIPGKLGVSRLPKPKPKPAPEVTTIESDDASDLPALTTNQKIILIHAVLLSFAFLVVLPLGALVARFTRTRSPVWFKRHWILQVAVAGPLILIGLAMGVFAVSRRQGLHWTGTHKQIGFLLVVIVYPSQLGLGYVIHRIKTANGRRPFRNYFHVALGLFTITLSFWQVRLGFVSEWPSVTGRGPVGNGWYSAWEAWAAILSLLYVGGLLLLPRQFEQERHMREYRVLQAIAEEQFVIADSSPRESEELLAPEWKEEGQYTDHA